MTLEILVNNFIPETDESGDEQPVEKYRLHSAESKHGSNSNVYLRPPESYSFVRGRPSSLSKASIEEFLKKLPDTRTEFTTSTMKDAFLDVFQHKPEKSKNLTLRDWIEKILHSRSLYLFQIVLVIVDIMFVLIQVVCDILLKDYSREHHIDLRNGTVLSLSKLVPNLHDEEYVHRIHVTELTVEIGSACILFIVICIAVAKIIFETREFFKSRLEIFDTCVVIISFVLEVTFIFKKGIVREIEAAAVVLRFWRIIRIMNGEDHAQLEQI